MIRSFGNRLATSGIATVANGPVKVAEAVWDTTMYPEGQYKLTVIAYGADVQNCTGAEVGCSVMSTLWAKRAA